MKLRRRGYLVEKFDIGIRQGTIERFVAIFVRKMRGYMDKMEQSAKYLSSNKDAKKSIHDLTPVKAQYYFDHVEILLREVRKDLNDVEYNRRETDSPYAVLRDIRFSIKYIDDQLEDLKKDIRAIEADSDFDENFDYEIEDLDSYEKIKDNFSTLFSTSKNLIERVQYTMKKIEATQQDKLENPAHSEKIETMYHASINAQNIFRNGFSKEKPEDSVGLGGSAQIGSGTKKGISFTYDLHAAKEIARVFKELTMAAKGQLKIRDIMDWAKREGIEDILKTYEISAARKSYYGHAALEPTLGAVQLLVVYYTASKKRFDPIFVTSPKRLYDKLKKINIRNIGVVVAKVDMTNVKTGEYVYNEREYRVTTDDIVKLVKVL